MHMYHSLFAGFIKQSVMKVSQVHLFHILPASIRLRGTWPALREFYSLAVSLPASVWSRYKAINKIKVAIPFSLPLASLSISAAVSLWLSLSALINRQN